MRFSCLCLIVVFGCGLAGAAEIVETTVSSVAMGSNMPVRVILPKGYRDSDARYPVVCILHGAGGTCKVVSDVHEQELCDQYGVIGVAPDGTKTGWWWDSPLEPQMKLETYVVKDVIPWIDRHYRTLASREKRAIVGESMGGHGACWIGFRHRDLFGAVGNVYGGVDVRAFEGQWNLETRLGPQAENPDLWRDHCAITEAAKLSNGDIELLTVVGTDDIFLMPNRRMHELLSANRVAHYYLEIRGETQELSSHTHPFRKEGERLVFRFVDSYFRKGRGSL